MNEPSPSDSNVVWAGTSAGRIFITTNARAADPASIQWKRIDPSSSVDPARYPTDVYVDPSDPNHAYITYSGYNHVTPDTPGHIFEVRYNPATGDGDVHVTRRHRLEGSRRPARRDDRAGREER